MQLLQAGNAGLLSAGVLVLLIAFVLAYYVYTDATERNRDNAVLWALDIGVLTLLTLVGGVLVFGVYV